LTHTTEHRASTDDSYALAVGGYSVFYKPSEKTGTLSPEWTIYQFERTKTTPFGTAGSGTNNALPENCKRASFFATAGQWKMTFTASLSVPHMNKPNPDIVYVSNGKNSFEVLIEGTKILVHSFEGAGAYVIPGTEKSIQVAFDDILNADKRIEWTKHTWTGDGNAVDQIIEKHNDCEGCGHYDTVVLVGHSFGGHAVMKCIEQLHDCTVKMWDEEKKFDISVSLAFTIDPVHQIWALLPPWNPTPRPASPGAWGFAKDQNITGSHLNFYQRCDTGSIARPPLPPIPIWGDTVTGTNNKEFAANDFVGTLLAHVNIVSLNDVKNAFATALKTVPNQKSASGRVSQH
jgi:pimeloyl-ACP methyl ester carboxylesterase